MGRKGSRIKMDLSELRRVQRQERSTDSLQELRESFYEDVADYIESLREERAQAARDATDLFRSPQVSELTSEIETAEHVAEAIYQRRIGKLVDEATLVATGNSGGPKGLTVEESDLYDDLVARIRENKQTVLERFSGDQPSVADSEPENDGTGAAGTNSSSTDESPSSETENGSEPRSADRGVNPTDEPLEGNSPSTTDAMGAKLDVREETGSASDAEKSDDGTDIERTTIRMTADVGEIFGVDARSYDLARDDVVDLPRENADPLVERDAAERVE